MAAVGRRSGEVAPGQPSGPARSWALEGYVKNVVKTQSQLLDLLERFPTQHLQVVCDPYNYLSRTSPAQERATAELLERFEDRFVVAHLKDVDRDGAEAGSPAFGTGIFPQGPYLEFLRDAETRSHL